MGRTFKKRKIKNFNKNAQSDHPPPPPPSPPPLDRLSSLPDAIIVDILSLLPAITAVSTSVLSNRWRFLWTQLTNLNLDCRHLPLQTAVFYTVVDQLLTNLTSLSLRTFSVRVPYPRQQHFEPWLRHLCSRNVEKIDVAVDGPGAPNDALPFTLPHCIFRTQSLVCLNFQTFWLNYELPDDTDVVINLPNLKKLVLILRASQCGFVAKLVRSCPLLQELTLSAKEGWRNDDDDNGAIIDISCGNLTQLQLNLFAASENTKVMIDAPKLNSFDLLAFSLICSFLKKPVGLRKAMIFTINQALLLSLLPVILNVRVLHTIAVTFGMFEDFKVDQSNSSIFRNLAELKLQFSGGGGDLDLFPFESTSPSLLIRIKKINLVILNVKHRENLMKLVEYFLSNAPSLERLAIVVHPHPSQSEDRLKYMLEEIVFCMDLYLCSRNSSQCLIEFRGQFAKLPATILELQQLRNQVMESYRLLSVGHVPELIDGVSPS